MKTCPYCGKELNNEKFCPECGKPIINESTSETPPVSISPQSPPTPPKSKKGLTLSTVLIILGSLIVAAMVVYYILNKDNKSTNKSSGLINSSSKVTSQLPIESEQPVKQRYSVGDSCTLEGITATVDSCEVFKYDGYSQPKDGYIYIKVHAIVENNSDKDVTLGSVNFECYANDQKIDNSFFAVDNYLSYGRISPGRYISGDIYYEVPLGADIELEYTPEWLMKKQKVIFELEY